MPGSVLRSEMFVVSAEWRGQRHKLFQCRFSKKDGSLFVSLPYFSQSTGLVSLATLPVGESATINLQEGGKVSSHLVKYSHHPDGRAHFSQDGKVLTVIKKNAVPLEGHGGHLFTLHIHGLRDFKALTDAEARQGPSVKRTGLTFTLEDGESDAVKFVGMLYRDTALERMAVGGLVQPRTHVVGPDGKPKAAFIVSTAAGLPGQERCLVLSCEAMPSLGHTGNSSVLFLGGFDAAAVMNDPTCSATFLALSYPVDDPEELRQRLGSIDYTPPNNRLQPAPALDMMGRRG